MTVTVFAPARATKRPSLYAAVWRWHFYAGLFCIPFIMVLALTGSIYLFKPQIEVWQDRPFDRLPTSGVYVPPERQLAAALTAMPRSTLQSIEVRRSADDAARVTLARDGESFRVLVHPTTARVLAVQAEDEQFIEVVRDIHGQLLMGDRGSLLVELAASWAIVMILTGLYLWWPRGMRSLAGIVYPRLAARGRVFWRDLHAVVGFWVSIFALGLLVTGLPWTSVWGDGFKTFREMTGTAAERDWSTQRSTTNEAGHAGHGGANAGTTAMGADGLGRMVATVRALDLPPPVLLSPPESGATTWTVRSDTPNRPLRTTVQLDPRTGEVIARRGFADRHPIDRAVGYGIAAHEGQLFGLANQLLGLFTAVGLVLLAVSGMVMWWRRRPEGRLGAPRAPSQARIGRGIFLVIVVAGLLLPLFGLSLVLVAVIEKLTLALLPSVRDWLGLRSNPRRRTSA